MTDDSISMRVTAEWDSIDDLAISLTDELDTDQLMELITLIDENLADWDFSKKLIKFGKALKKQYRAENIEESLNNEA